MDADAVGDAQPARLERVVRRAAGDRLPGQRARPRRVGHVPGRVDLLVVDRVQAGRRVQSRHADRDRVALGDLQVLEQPQREVRAVDRDDRPVHARDARRVDLRRDRLGRLAQVARRA